MSLSSFSVPRHPARLALAALLTGSLAACYVVPIDPKTGQGYPIAPAYPGDHAGTGSAAARPAAAVAPATPGPTQPSTMTARLYPLNAQANKGGMLTAVVVDNNTGRGSFSLSYLGDTLQGESSRVDSNYAAFGRIHSEVLGTPRDRGYSGRRGIANAFGAKGVNVQCEYLISGPTMGTGACQFSDGAKYQLHFGG